MGFLGNIIYHSKIVIFKNTGQFQLSMDKDDILKINTEALNALLIKVISEKCPQLGTEDLQKMVTQAAEIAGKSIQAGIEGSLVEIANRAAEERAAIMPIEREVDTLLIWDMLGYDSTQPYTKQFEKFLESHAQELNYDRSINIPKERKNQSEGYLGYGICIRFKDSLKDREATSILGTEGIWFMHRNVRYLVYDGNTSMSPAVLDNFKSSQHSNDSFGVIVCSTISRYDNDFKVYFKHDLQSEEGKNSLILTATPIGRKKG